MERTRLKKYEILRPLATGGMAEVHLARTTGAVGIEKLLVIKRLLPELAANKQFVRMFLDEARLAVALDHANIVQVYDVDEADGAVFYAMEFLHGRDVRQIVRRLRARGMRMPLDQAVSIVITVCAALHYAHEMKGKGGHPLGIVHRDVSPHNVFVRFDGVVKVIDFGIAKANSHLERTATGVLRGKFGYMSPEQCLSQPLDRRSDVFSIAILLHELTTGRRLYDGTSEYAVLKRIIESDPESPSAKDTTYPAELERIVMKGLRRDRSVRYATAEALQLDLEEYARREDMDMSSRALARFMDVIFTEEVAAWREGQRSGSLVLPAASSQEDDTDTETEPRLSTPLPHAEARDETRSAAVTETLAPVPGRLGAKRVALVATPAGAIAVALAVWSLARAPEVDEPRPTALPMESARAPTMPAVASDQPSVTPVEAAPRDDAGTAEPRASSRVRTPAPPRPGPRIPPKPRRPDPDAPLPH